MTPVPVIDARRQVDEADSVGGSVASGDPALRGARAPFGFAGIGVTLSLRSKCTLGVLACPWYDGERHSMAEQCFGFEGQDV